VPARQIKAACSFWLSGLSVSRNLKPANKTLKPGNYFVDFRRIFTVALCIVPRVTWIDVGYGHEVVVISLRGLKAGKNGIE
jgi:hypothetical protein